MMSVHAVTAWSTHLHLSRPVVWLSELMWQYGSTAQLNNQKTRVQASILLHVSWIIWIIIIQNIPCGASIRRPRLVQHWVNISCLLGNAQLAKSNLAAARTSSRSCYQCCFDGGSPSETLGHHQTTLGVARLLKVPWLHPCTVSPYYLPKPTQILDRIPPASPSDPVPCQNSARAGRGGMK